MDEFFSIQVSAFRQKKKTNLCAQNVFEVFEMCFSPELLNFMFLKKSLKRAQNFFKKLEIICFVLLR